jgi:hypothetical protein
MSNLRFSRRRFISSAGVTVTLPMLPSLLYTRHASAASCSPVKRFVAYMYPNGLHMAESIPASVGAGSAWALPTMLATLEPVKSDLVLVTGLENQMRRRTGVGDHAMGCGALFTARKPTANQQVNNTSVDQIIADQLMGCRGLHSLQLGTENTGGNDDYGTYYTRSISWRGTVTANADGSKTFPTGTATPLGKEVDPVKAFNRLFQGSDPNASAADAKMRKALRKSVLDTIVPHGDWLKNKLNPEDNAKVDELFTGIRSLEQEIDSNAQATACVKPDAPVNTADVQKKIEIFHDLMAVGFQCDVTRVFSFMMGDALSSKNLSFIPVVKETGGAAGHHAVSHHSGDTAMVKKFKAMVLWELGLMAGFVKKLKSMTDYDGKPVLDNTLVMFGSELADGNRHNHDDKPIFLAGKLGGSVVTDRHTRFIPNRDYTLGKCYGDFFITLLGLYDVKVTTFGNDGKEAIEWNR